MTTDLSGPGRMTRKQFIRKAAVGAAALGAAAVGLGGVARAQAAGGLPVTPNPDPGHIKVVSPDYIEVYPVSDPARMTVLEWRASGQPQRMQDPRLSVVDPVSMVWEQDENGEYWLVSAAPLSETSNFDQSVEWDRRRRTIDAMNVEWAANNVAKKNDGTPGTVLLKHTETPFHFGTGWVTSSIPSRDLPPGYGVLICNDCIIRGETGPGGEPLTMLKGGAGAFIGGWSLGAFLPWLFGYFDEQGNPLFGIQCWHDFAAKMIAFRNLIMEDPMYPALHTRGGSDLTNGNEYDLAVSEAENIRIINARPNPEGGGPGAPANLPIIFENEAAGISIVRNCSVSLAPERGFLIAGIASFSEKEELLNNTVHIPLIPDAEPWDFISGFVTLSFSPGTIVQNNRVTVMNPSGLGLEINGGSGHFLDNKFFGQSAGIIIYGNGNTIQNADFTGLTLPAESPDYRCILLVSWFDADGGAWVIPQSNQVYEHAQLGVKYFPPGTTLCSQVLNYETDESGNPLPPEQWTNNIHQWDRLCSGTHPAFSKITELQQKFAAHRAALDKLRLRPGRK